MFEVVGSNPTRRGRGFVFLVIPLAINYPSLQIVGRSVHVCIVAHVKNPLVVGNCKKRVGQIVAAGVRSRKLQPRRRLGRSFYELISSCLALMIFLVFFDHLRYQASL